MTATLPRKFVPSTTINKSLGDVESYLIAPEPADTTDPSIGAIRIFDRCMVSFLGASPTVYNYEKSLSEFFQKLPK